MGAKCSNLPPDERLTSVYHEAKAVFDERYAKELRDNVFANNGSIWAADAGLYIRRIGSWSCVLIVAGRDNRASDAALKAAFDYLSELKLRDHRCFVESATRLNKRHACCGPPEGVMITPIP